MKLLFTIFISFLFFLGENYAQENKIEVGIDEKLGGYLPMDAVFLNEKGDSVTLKSLIDRPTILSLVYYECPGICAPLLTELAWVVNKVDLIPLKDFKVLTISFDHKETPQIASKWKKNYFAGMKNPFPDSAWAFLTGDSLTINKLTESVGFYFKKEGNEYTHAGTLIAISPDGKISRYLFGQTFNQFDVKMALIDAESGKTNPTIAKVLQFCFSYDPDGRRYSLNVTRISGSFVLLAVGLFFIYLVFNKKKKNSIKENS